MLEKPVKKTETEKACPDCGGTKTVQDPDNGEIICQSCGLVLNENNIVNTRPVAYTQEQAEARMHTGLPTSYSVHDKGLSTIISHDTRDAFGRKLPANKQAEMYRLKKWQTRLRINNSQERNLAEAFSLIERYGDRLGLSSVVKERAAIKYRKANEKNLTKGRSICDVVAASIYLVCRESKVLRNLKEIEKVSGIDKKIIGKDYRLLLKELNNTSPSPQSSTAYISKCAESLKLPGEIVGDAIQILQKARRDCVGKDPRSVAAAALYIACNDKLIETTDGKHLTVTQKVISENMGVTEVTIRNRYKTINRFLKAHGNQGGGI